MHAMNISPFSWTWCPRLKAVCFALMTSVVLTNIAAAQSEPRELFTPLQQNLFAGNESPQIKALKEQPTTKSLQLVKIDLGALRDSKVKLTMDDQQSLTFSKQSIEAGDNGNFVWRGSLSDIPGSATLVVHNNNVTGTIQNGDDLYRIEPVGGDVHALIKVDWSKFPPDHPPSFEGKRQEQHGQTRPQGLPADQHDGPVTIDVLVAYTNSAKSSVSDIDATIRLAVEEANASYKNSGVNISLQLVDSIQVNYSEAGKDFDTILADFVSNPDVNKHRDTSGADLAALIINKNDYCGLADAILANAATAFAIVHSGCATGYYSFAHELGHLMGARHDEASDPNTLPYGYGHGYQHTASPSWRTIMAYPCTGKCPRLQYWSNPNVKYSNEPMGTVELNNNSRVLNENATTIASFRNRPSVRNSESERSDTPK